MWIEILIGFVTLVFAYGAYLKLYKWKHFVRRGMHQLETRFPFGNFNEMVLQKKHINDIFGECYFEGKGHKLFGTYFLQRPSIMVRDPELLRRILVKEFDHFVDRQRDDISKLTHTKTDQVWSRQLTNLTGDEWKAVRSTFSPIFTSGKMKAMMTFIRETSSSLKEELNKAAKSGDDVELKDVFGKFSMDTIASCAFGVDAGSFKATKENESLFVKYASAVFRRGTLENLKFFLIIVPGVIQMFRFFRISLFKPTETRFFVDVIKQTLKERQANYNKGPQRNDLIDMMIRAMKEEETVEEEPKDQFDLDSELKKTARKKAEFDEFTIVATAMLMLIAGYDTTAQTLAYAGFELARHPEIQQRLQEEVDAAFEESADGSPDYNTIQNLPYLDMIVHEALRLHPPAGLLSRVCIKDCKIDGIEFKKDDQILIPVSGIHMDPEFYPNPTQFNPENFSKERRANRNPYTFLGFGQGPRACLAMRFALLEVKVALVNVVRNFNFVTCSKTVEKIELDPKSALGGNIGGLWVKPELRNH